MRVKGFNILRQEADLKKRYFAKVGDLAHPDDVAQFADDLHDNVRSDLMADTHAQESGITIPALDAVKSVVRRNMIPQFDYPEIIDSVSDYLYQRMLGVS